MTAKEFAVRVWGLLSKPNTTTSNESLKYAELESIINQFLASAKREAYEEGYKDGEKSMRGYNDDTLVWKKVKEAYLDAAKIAEVFAQNHIGYAGDWDSGAEVTARRIAAKLREKAGE